MRRQLSQDLSQESSFTTSFRSDDDDRCVYKSFPVRHVEAVILHRRLLIDKTVVQPMQAKNYCIECTLLKDGGQEDPRFKLGLFRIGDVGTYITRSKANLIVSLLHLCTDLCLQ